MAWSMRRQSLAMSIVSAARAQDRKAPSSDRQLARPLLRPEPRRRPTPVLHRYRGDGLWASTSIAVLFNTESWRWRHGGSSSGRDVAASGRGLPLRGHCCRWHKSEAVIHGQPWKMKSRHSLCDADVLARRSATQRSGRRHPMTGSRR